VLLVVCAVPTRTGLRGRIARGGVSQTTIGAEFHNDASRSATCELRFARALDRRACAYLPVPTVIVAGHVKAVGPRGGERAIGRAAGAPPPRNARAAVWRA
jgi:hypothetical protein